jgi:hypothetical protein
MFAELSQGRHPVPVQSIADNLSQRSLADVESVVAYLSGGHVLIDMMDVENDALDPSRELINGSSILTDGDWLWRKDYSYYVRRHNVVVPEELLTMIRERNYVVPPVPEPRLIDLSEQAEPLAFGDT